MVNSFIQSFINFDDDDDDDGSGDCGHIPLFLPGAAFYYYYYYLFNIIIIMGCNYELSAVTVAWGSDDGDITYSIHPWIHWPRMYTF